MTVRSARLVALAIPLALTHHARSSQPESAPGSAPESAPARSAQNNADRDEMTPELDRAVSRGLAALASVQNEDGSWDAGRFGKNVAITALACIALMGDGNLPGRGVYGSQVERGLDFVLSTSAENGLLAADAANGPMYGHGFAALFLGEIAGMTRGGPDTARAQRVHEALVRAIRLIEQTQNEEGGWRYNPVPYDADVSVTICQIMALRSARNAGIEVSSQVIDRAVEYVRRCQNPDGGFKYQADSGASAWPRSAAGIASLFYAGIYTDDAIDRGLAYIESTAMPGVANTRSRAHYHYGHYYAVQAMYLAGGARWTTWWRAVREDMIAAQNDDGTWTDRSVGDTYATAMSLIVLQMPKRYLPIFQK